MQYFTSMNMLRTHAPKMPLKAQILYLITTSKLVLPRNCYTLKQRFFAVENLEVKIYLV